MAKAMLKLDNIVKDYKVADTTVHALKGVSLSFRKNEFVSVLGHSGCGKTTLLNIIGGLDHYTSGDLMIRGKSTKNYTDKDWDFYRNHSIGFVFQSYNLIPHQSVLGNVELALTLSGISASERKERAKQALIRVGLAEHIDKKPNQLSGGQMQRVAIARALVNDPEILLADEPTGALDTETSVQIMDLIKEIAGERLVIMVTHNPELAERYSTRIVRLTDGVVQDDSDPFTEDNEEEGETPAQPKAKKGKKKKTSMSFLTAFGLSGRNLLTKRGRTLVTSIAGSIGIIGVCLVLALSSGFGGYITRTEEDMLSAYPVEITETAMDYATLMENMMSGMSKPDVGKLNDKVYVNSFLSKIAQGMSVQNNITEEYLEYVSKVNPEYYYALQYGYGVDLDMCVFTEVSVNPSVMGAQYPGLSFPSTMKANLSIYQIYNWYSALLGTQEDYASLMALMPTIGSTFAKMPGTSSADFAKENYADYIMSEYDVVTGKMAAAPDEIVLVIDGQSRVTDLVLAQLGFLTQDEFLALFDESEEEREELTIDFSDILDKEFTLYYNNKIFTENPDYQANTNKYRFLYTDPDLNTLYEIGGQKASLGGVDTLDPADEKEGVKLKITGILKPKKDMNYGCLNVGLNCTEALVEQLIEENMQSDIIRWMNTEGEGKITDGETVTYKVPCSSFTSYGKNMEGTTKIDPVIDFATHSAQETVMRLIGGSNIPNAVYIYARDFDGKDGITDYLDAWNDSHSEEERIQYTDKVGLMMAIMQTMLDAITYVLIAFTGISLVVSSVMIGVITYVSVVERTKEIGVLRSIGARKRDIKHVFNAETFIIGLCAGLIGVFVSYLLCLIVNLILTPLTGISGLASLPVWQAAVMVLVSVVLTLVSGLIPASAAAKKDPVIALRTE